MARLGLRNHPKFRRLVALLRLPEAYVLGHLQMLWETAYEIGPEIGDATDVEVAAGWVGEPGVLCSALATCGGSGRHGFLEPNPELPDCFLVHDLWDHAPEYVSRRVGKEIARKKDRPCQHCGTIFHSTEPHARYCSHACRSAAYRVRHGDHGVTDGDADLRHGDGDVSHCDEPPSPSPSPSTATATPPSAGAEGQLQPMPPKKARPPRGRNYSLTLTSMDEAVRREFLRAWDGYPAEGWNFQTKGWARRRLNQEGTAQRFVEILQHNQIKTLRGDRIDAEALADITLYFVAARRRHAERKGEPLNIPCIENFFSAVDGAKANPWQNAASAWLGAGCPRMNQAPPISQPASMEAVHG